MSTESRFLRWFTRWESRNERNVAKNYPSRKWVQNNPLNRTPMRQTMWKARKIKEGGIDTLRVDMRIYRMMLNRITN